MGGIILPFILGPWREGACLYFQGIKLNFICKNFLANNYIEDLIYHCLSTWPVTDRGELKSPTNVFVPISSCIFHNLCYMMLLYYLVYRFSWLFYLHCGSSLSHSVWYFWCIKAFKVLCGQILSILPFMVSVFCVILKEAITTPSF